MKKCDSIKKLKSNYVQIVKTYIQTGRGWIIYLDLIIIIKKERKNR